jgi:3',5'-cyclic AMP phosphodiesterase CpdA
LIFVFIVCVAMSCTTLEGVTVTVPAATQVRGTAGTAPATIATLPEGSSAARPVTEAAADPPSAGLSARNIAELTSEEAVAPFTFVVIGDTQDQSPTDAGGSEIFALLIEQINALQPDFVIHLGDVSDRGTAIELDRFDDLIAKLEAPILTVAGNHDTKSRRKLFSERYASPNAVTGLMDYSFDYRGVRFIVLDNSEYYLSRDQLAWLGNQLQTPKRKVVAMHCPPDYGRLEDMGGMYSPEPFMRLMNEHGVEYVFSGHIHLHTVMKVAGTRYVISGTGGGTLSGRDQGVKDHGFDVVRVDDERISAEFVRLSVHRP